MPTVDDRRVFLKVLEAARMRSGVRASLVVVAALCMPMALLAGPASAGMLVPSAGVAALREADAPPVTWLMVRGVGEWKVACVGGTGDDALGRRVSMMAGTITTTTTDDASGPPAAPTAAARATSYDAFGKPGSGMAGVTPTFGYRGELTIDSLTYLRARNYDAANGVFTSRDPLDGVAGTSVVAYPYHYGSNSPLMNVDPSGMSNLNDNLFNSTTDVWGNALKTYNGDQVFFQGQWMNVEIFQKLQIAQSKSEAQQAMAAADRLDRIGVSGTIIATVGAGVAGTGCAVVGAAAGPIAAGALGATCGGYVNRLLTSFAAGDSALDAFTAAGDPKAIAIDAATGAIMAGAVVGGGALASRLGSAAATEAAGAAAPAAQEAAAATSTTGTAAFGDSQTITAQTIQQEVTAEAGTDLVMYDPEWASRQMLDQNIPGSNGYGVTPGGRTVSAHAAERISVGGPGRPPTSLSTVDEILDTGTSVRYDPIRDSIQVRAPQMPGKPYVVVDSSGTHIVTVMVPK